jgi:hypothetical protein
MASLADPKDIAGLLEAIDSYPDGIVKLALKMSLY